MTGRDRLGRPRAALRLRIAALAAAVAGLCLVWAASPAADAMRARIFDRAAAAAGWTDALPRPVVVAIDRETLAAVGSWPWGRDRLAGLLGAIADAGPRVLALDLLLEGPDLRSPAALARLLAGRTGDPGIAALSRRMPDGDAMLAGTLRRQPSVLGLALDPSRADPGFPLPPVLVLNPTGGPTLWRGAGFVGPPDGLSAAGSTAVIALPGDADGTVRHVPLVAEAGGRLAPGFAVETLRRAGGDAPVLVDLAGRTLRAGTLSAPLGPAGLMRLMPVGAEARAASRISALAIARGDRPSLARLAGAIVLVGGTAPELGGLRAAAGGALVASVDLHADAVAQLAAGLFPGRPAPIRAAETAAILIGALAAAAAALAAGPVRGGLSVLALAALWSGASLAGSAGFLVESDPVTPAVACLATFGLSALAVAQDRERRAAQVRAAFEQHLAPAVVRRIAEAPDRLRLAGERRRVTALFTDIEGFSALTERAGPEELVAVLDGYFEGVAGIVTDRDGMIDKIVGDAVHALFNVPVDLDDPARRALDAAEAVLAFSERHRSRPECRALDLGRTRIGIETGWAIVGNVGGGRKLDYTAHGSAVNAAARLEQANKALGTAILIGPGAASEIAGERLMPLGAFGVRGLASEQALCTIWPDGASEALKARWRAAIAADDPAAGAGPDLAALAARLAAVRREGRPIG